MSYSASKLHKNKGHRDLIFMEGSKAADVRAINNNIVISSRTVCRTVLPTFNCIRFSMQMLIVIKGIIVTGHIDTPTEIVFESDADSSSEHNVRSIRKSLTIADASFRRNGRLLNMDVIDEDVALLPPTVPSFRSHSAYAETDCTVAALGASDLLAIRNKRPMVDRHLYRFCDAAWTRRRTGLVASILRSVDVDVTGLLDQEDFRVAVKKLGLQLTSAELDQEFAALLETSLDLVDGSRTEVIEAEGSITWSQFQAWCTHHDHHDQHQCAISTGLLFAFTTPSNTFHVHKDKISRSESQVSHVGTVEMKITPI
eukprot:SAG31_NODE_2734_length_5172_cov_2.068007_4_plen_313_part_00